MREAMIHNRDKYQFRKGALERILEIIAKQASGNQAQHLFFGDSLVANMPKTWKITNNGIGGLTSSILENLLDELVIKFNPKRVYLHIGTNDLGDTVMASPRTIAINVKNVFDVLMRNLPKTEFYLISTLPCVDERDSLYSLGRGIRMNDLHAVLNKEYKEHLAFMDVKFIDLNQYLTNSDGSIKKEYYEDGLHITQEGYNYLLECYRKNCEHNSKRSE